MVKQLRQLQKDWKKAGAVPKDRFDQLQKRYQAACDALQDRYRAHKAQQEEARSGNLVKKEQLCVEVEKLAESADWEATTEAIKQLQAQWKAIGAVPRSKADEVWQRFRAACDKFFERRRVPSRGGRGRAQRQRGR